MYESLTHVYLMRLSGELSSSRGERLAEKKARQVEHPTETSHAQRTNPFKNSPMLLTEYFVRMAAHLILTIDVVSLQPVVDNAQNSFFHSAILFGPSAAA